MDETHGQRRSCDQLQLFDVSSVKRVYGARRGHRRPRGPETSPRTCECGSPLRWEARHNLGGVRRIALCRNPGCGIVTEARGDQAEDALRSYLIGDQPSYRYVPPWVRFLKRAMTAGFVCRVADRDCSECESHTTFAVYLPPTLRRLGDGVRARLCMSCGGVRITYWHMGRRSEINSDGGDWVRLNGPVVGLKAALTERLEGKYPEPPDAD